MDLIRTKHWSIISVDEQLKNVMRACQVRAKSDPVPGRDHQFGSAVVQHLAK